MEKDKKAVEGTEVQATEATETTEAKEVNLKLTRRQITTKDKRKLWGYEVNGTVSKRPVKVDFSAKDAGGYGLLDLLFDVAVEAGHDVVLVMRDEKMTNDNGVTSTYTVYEAYTTDVEGNDLVCPVKPRLGSDKALLMNLLAQMKKGGATA